MSNKGDNPTLSPQLKSWIDNVLVPTLVRQYLARLECEKKLAIEAEPTVEFAPAHAVIEGER